DIVGARTLGAAEKFGARLIALQDAQKHALRRDHLARNRFVVAVNKFRRARFTTERWPAFPCVVVCRRRASSARKQLGGARQEPKACCRTGLSGYEHGEDKRRIHAAGNHFMLSRSQRRIISAEMMADGLAVDDRSKRAAEVAHMITSAALLDHEVVAR